MTKQTRAWLGRWAPGLARQLARSWRVEVFGTDYGRELFRAGCPYVLLCWHDVLLPVMWHHRRRGISAVISEARDGQYLATFAESLGYGLIRGSSTRGGGRALRAAIRALASGTPIGITPDGPRGPSRVLKPGVVAAAAVGGALLLPVHAVGRPAWRAASWDRFLVPSPFARVRLAYGEPFRAGAEGMESAVERTLRELDEAARKVEWPDAGVATPTA